jgi:two-component system chemotaxis response regulator CheY
MRVLIVDDIPAMHLFLKFTLKALKGVSCDSAHDGLQALQMLSRDSYQLVLLDLSLPLLDGMKLLAQLRAADSSNRRTPIIVISTIHDQDTLRRARNFDVSHVFNKPMQAARLLDAVREVLNIVDPKAQHDSRRAARRLSIPVRMRFGGESAFEATTWDISHAGAFVMSGRLKLVGAQATAELLVPYAKPVEVAAEVVHVRTNAVGELPAGFGIRFINVELQTAKRLVDLFNSPAE